MKKITVILAYVVFLTGEVQAIDYSDDPLPSIVSLELASHASDSSEQFLDLDYGLQSAVRLQAGYSKSSYEGRFSNNRSEAWLVGMSSDPLDKFVVGLMYEKWRRKENNPFNTNVLRLRRDTVIGSVKWQTLDWSVTFTPRQRNINILPANTNLVIGIRSPGYGLAVSYYGLGDVSLSFSQLEYDYSNNIDLLRDITARSVTLAARIADQFDESKSTVNLDYNFSKAALGVEWQRSVAVANLDVYKAIILNAFIEINRDWSLLGKLGRPVGATLEDEGFGSIAITFSW